MSQSSSTDSLSGLDALSDVVRRRLYRFVAGHEEPVSRSDAAAAVGITRSLAAYHLDRLVDAGLLTFSYARSEGRSGPGAGRPAKRYSRASDEISFTMPPRSYGLLAGLLAQAVETDPTGSAQSALYASAEEEGRKAAAEAPDAIAGLTSRGYQPEVNEDGDIVMTNCPFHQIARQKPELVCTLNHALLRGYLDARGDDPARAELSPCPGRCCVVIRGTAENQPAP